MSASSKLALFEERERDRLPYVIVSKTPHRRLLIHTQEVVASALCGAGAIWLTSSFTQNYSPATAATPLRPLELCAAGLVLWLAAKWRRATKTS